MSVDAPASLYELPSSIVTGLEPFNDITGGVLSSSSNTWSNIPADPTNNKNFCSIDNSLKISALLVLIAFILSGFWVLASSSDKLASSCISISFWALNSIADILSSLFSISLSL